MIINLLYVLIDSIILSKKYGFKLWIILSSSILFIIPFILFVRDSALIVYLYIYILISLVGMLLGKIAGHLKKLLVIKYHLFFSTLNHVTLKSK